MQVTDPSDILPPALNTYFAHRMFDLLLMVEFIIKDLTYPGLVSPSVMGEKICPNRLHILRVMHIQSCFKPQGDGRNPLSFNAGNNHFCDIKVALEIKINPFVHLTTSQQEGKCSVAIFWVINNGGNNILIWIALSAVQQFFDYLCFYAPLSFPEDSVKILTKTLNVNTRRFLTQQFSVNAIKLMLMYTHWTPLQQTEHICVVGLFVIQL